MKLLNKLCHIHAPSGEEVYMKEFILSYIRNNKKDWNVQPILHYGSEFQDNLILVFGNPKTAIFAHMDSIGFTVRYNNEIVKIGSPKSEDGIILTGQDSMGKIKGKIINKNGRIFIDFDRVIDTGTSLTFQVNFKETDDYIESAYLDNRLGVWNCLEIAKTLENGIIVFSSWEEHGGGSVGYLAKFVQEKYNVFQALISDITWITEGVHAGSGCVISIRDSAIPRRSFVNKVIKIAKDSKIPFQVEVESSGGSDGNQLQSSPYSWDWCFVGAAENNVHSPNEKVNKKDIFSMVKLYKNLLKNL